MYVVCRDGFEVSVVASKYAYSCPRVDDAQRYQSVEVGYPSSFERLLGSSPDDIFGWVPMPVVVQIIENHGGANRMPKWLNAEFVDIVELDRIQDKLEGVRNRYVY
jgi:hypothetical protein